MSLGYLGYAKLFIEDEEVVIYEYSGENWNSKESKSGDALVCDGEVIIKKCSLEEPEIHQKIKRSKNRRKKLETKRIIHFVDIQEKIINGDIIITKKCKNEFSRFNSEECYIANKLLQRIVSAK